MELTRDLPAVAILRISLPWGRVQSPCRRHRLDRIRAFRKDAPATSILMKCVRALTPTISNPVFEALPRRRRAWLLSPGRPRAMTLTKIGQIVNRTAPIAPSLLHAVPARQPVPCLRVRHVSMLHDSSVRALARIHFRPWPLDPELSRTSPVARQSRSRREARHNRNRGGSSTTWIISFSREPQASAGQTNQHRLQNEADYIPSPWLLLV